jgi:membrane protein DedA with SNARE-associated domain
MGDIFTSIETYGYIILFLYSFGGGMVALIAAGVLSYAGKLDLTTSLAVAFVANMLGDVLLFYMGRYNKEQIMPYVHKHRRKLALSHILMKKYGWIIIFLQKYIYGVKTLIPIAIGLTKYDQKLFYILNIFAALLWTIVIGMSSFYSGEAVIGFVNMISEKPYIAPIILFSVGGSIWLYLQYATKKK